VPRAQRQENQRRPTTHYITFSNTQQAGRQAGRREGMIAEKSQTSDHRKQVGDGDADEDKVQRCYGNRITGGCRR